MHGGYVPSELEEPVHSSEILMSLMTSHDLVLYILTALHLCASLRQPYITISCACLSQQTSTNTHTQLLFPQKQHNTG